MGEDQLTSEEKAFYRMAARQLEKQNFDENKAWVKVCNKIQKNTLRVYIRRFCRYAAIFLVLSMTALFIWVYTQRKEQEPLWATASPAIVPGTNKAELILASGEKLILGQSVEVTRVVQPGVFVMVDTLNGRVSYVNETEEQDSLVVYNMLSVPKGGEYTLTLADGTTVWLNSESSIKFPVRFQGQKREVHLEGEAFFKVKHDTTAPFHVYVGGDDICVLGTSFNVCAYSGESFWHTTLVEGKVIVRHEGQELRLNPSGQYQLNTVTREVKVQNVDTELYTSWMNGKLFFKGFRLEDIVRQLERWYDFNMFYENEDLKELKFRGVINKYDSFDTVLKILEQTTDIQFTIHGNTVVARKIFRK